MKLTWPLSDQLVSLRVPLYFINSDHCSVQHHWSKSRAVANLGDPQRSKIMGLRPHQCRRCPWYLLCRSLPTYFHSGIRLHQRTSSALLRHPIRLCHSHSLGRLLSERPSERKGTHLVPLPYALKRRLHHTTHCLQPNRQDGSSLLHHIRPLPISNTTCLLAWHQHGRVYKAWDYLGYGRNFWSILLDHGYPRLH
jgi:hypothetical protein